MVEEIFPRLAGELFVPFLEFVIFTAAVWIVIYFASRRIRMIAAKTKTTLDDRLLKALKTPLFLLLVLIGFYVLLLKSPPLAVYDGAVDEIMATVWIVVGAWMFAGIGNAILGWYVETASKERPAFATALATIKTVWSVFVWMIALMMALSIFGMEIGPLIASLGIVGLAAALAFQETLQNFFAGLNIAAERRIRIGDYIKLSSGEEGNVSYLGWRSTTIKEPSGNEIMIPNTKLAQAIVRNYAPTKEGYTFSVPFAVAHDIDLNLLEETVIDVAIKIQKKVKGAVRSYAPLIRYSAFNNSAIEFNVILQAEDFTSQFLMRHEIIKAMQRRFGREGISMPHLQRDIFIKGIAGLAAAAARKKKTEARPAPAKPAAKAKPRKARSKPKAKSARKRAGRKK